MNKKKKIIIIGIIALVLVIIGTTYAILTWTSSKINLGLNSACFTIDYAKGQDISGNLKLMDWSEIYSNEDNTFMIKEGMGLSYINIGIKSTCTIEGYGSIYLNVTELSDTFKEGGDSEGALGVILLKNTSTLSNDKLTIDNLKEQSFELIDAKAITEIGKMTLITEQLSNTELNKYLIVIAVDSNSAGNDITTASFNGNISADAEQLVPTPSYCFDIYIEDETNKEASISDYNCYEGNSDGYETITDVVIPKKINGYTITSISNYSGAGCSRANVCSFHQKGIKSVIIPDSVTAIKDYAFELNQLVNVTIPNSVTTIGEGAFEFNQLVNVTIPSSVTTIGSNAFRNNDLNWVLINSDSNLTTIGHNAFSSSNDITTSFEITYYDNPNLKIYNNSGKAFDWNNVVSGKSGTSFVTGTTNAYTSGSIIYNAVTVTTGQPS